jgi:hypothetical protein
VLFANKNVIVNSRIKLSCYEQKDNTDNERDKKAEGHINGGRKADDKG